MLVTAQALMFIVCVASGPGVENLQNRKLTLRTLGLWFSRVSLSMGSTALLIASKLCKGSGIPYCLGLGSGSLGDPAICKVG